MVAELKPRNKNPAIQHGLSACCRLGHVLVSASLQASTSAYKSQMLAIYSSSLDTEANFQVRPQCFLKVSLVGGRACASSRTILSTLCSKYT